MTFPAIVFATMLAALTVAPSDRLAMADRLFNRGDYASARREYLALKGEKGVDEADVLYRLAAASEGMKDAKAVRADADAFLAKFAAHRLADRVRLMRALVCEGEERRKELRMLDRDDADPSLRAEALFHLAKMSNDASLYERCRKLDPKGRFAAYASFYHASAALESADAAARRRGLAELMEIVYGKDAALAKDALYLAAVHSYREAKYGESAALLKRYQKLYHGDARLPEVRRLVALSELMGGHYAAALACCTDDKDDTLVFVKATANERMGNRDEALALARKYLEEFPQGRHRDALELERARMEFDAAAKSGDKAKALDAAKRAVAFGKGAVAFDRLRCAWALELAGEAEKAEAEYASVAKDFPGKGDAAEAMYRRAMSLLRREQWAAAELSLAEALASGIDGERRALALYWRGVASMRSGHAAEGVALLKDAVKAGLPLDESREARLMIADADFNSGRTEEAKAAYTELIRQGALERMGAAKTLSVGKLLGGEEARLCAQSLVKSDSAEWRQAGYALLGSVEEAAGAYGAAVYAYSKAMEEKCSTESLAKVALRLGVLESRGGDPVKAEEALKRAVELNAKDQSARAEAYLALAEAALQRRDVEKARGYATVVTTLFENSQFSKRAEEILKSNLEEEQ